MESVSDLIRFLGFFGWILIIAVFGIVFGTTSQSVVTIFRMRIKHAERMAMIGAGDDPGDVEKAYKSDTPKKK